jgi:hypothetical protein
VKVSKHVVVLFFIGKYVDEILCDVILILASKSHLLGETLVVR